MTDKDVTNSAIVRIVSERLREALQECDVTLDVTPQTPIFGRHSPLDSLRLVSLIVDIEEGIYDQACCGLCSP